jgi:predicted ArsR family transcriptional regulator
VSGHADGGARRRQVLEVIYGAPAPLGASEIAGQAGIHPNTARFHLGALTADGVIERMVEEPCRPGRPRVVYRARPGMARGGERRYDVLAEILLGCLTGTDSGRAAADAGRAWGERAIGRAAPPGQVSGAEAVSRVLGLLDELAFAPEALTGDDLPAQVRLRHCPFLELAEDHREIVCPLHLGLIQGAFAGLSSPVTATDLTPFAESDACIVHLAPAG